MWYLSVMAGVMNLKVCALTKERMFWNMRWKKGPFGAKIYLYRRADSFLFGLGPVA